MWEVVWFGFEQMKLWRIGNSFWWGAKVHTLGLHPCMIHFDMFQTHVWDPPPSKLCPNSLNMVICEDFNGMSIISSTKIEEQKNRNLSPLTHPNWWNVWNHEGLFLALILAICKKVVLLFLYPHFVCHSLFFCVFVSWLLHVCFPMSIIHLSPQKKIILKDKIGVHYKLPIPANTSHSMMIDNVSKTLKIHSSFVGLFGQLSGCALLISCHCMEMLSSHDSC